MIIRRLFFVLNFIAILTLLAQGGNYKLGRASSSITLEGTFITVWGDGSSDSTETHVRYFLATTKMDTIQLMIDDNLVTSLGGLITLNRRPVIVDGTWLEEGISLQVLSMTSANGEAGRTEGIYGPQPWVSILCKFSDFSAEPENLAYFLDMYSSNYPGLDHFWRELSFDQVNLEGSNAYGWYTLPHPRSYYVPEGGYMDWGAAAYDCTRVAENDIYYPNYVGINMMFNANLDCCAWGGSWYLCLDGQCQNWRMTWEPPWGYQNIGVIAHETGHGFGLPHSYWNPLVVYDNQWDVMSDVWSNSNRGGIHPVYGTMGQHTISYHKDLLGWIDDSQMAVIGTGRIQTLTLERLASPQNDNYLGVRILVDDSPYHFLTVEARQLVGYDTWLPRQAGWDQAVVLHDVHSYDNMPARVIDIDQDGYTDDESVMWLPGETYITPTLGIEVSVLSATDTGFVVNISNRFTAMSAVEIEGLALGTAFESIPFTATVSPDEATTPITYTWEATSLPPVTHVGDTADSIEFRWEETGTKVITVTASNAGSTVVDTQFIEINSLVPIVSLSGPAESLVGALNVFTATVVPTDVLTPITYTWQASGQIPITQTGEIIDSVNYVWDDPGTQVITVTASNSYGATTTGHSLVVRMPPAQLELKGPDMGRLGESDVFTATVSPINTTLPITYIWSLDGQFTITHTVGISDTALFNWNRPGLHQIEVSATNPVGSVADTWSITIYFRVFLPIGMQN